MCQNLLPFAIIPRVPLAAYTHHSVRCAILHRRHCSGVAACVTGHRHRPLPVTIPHVPLSIWSGAMLRALTLDINHETVSPTPAMRWIAPRRTPNPYRKQPLQSNRNKNQPSAPSRHPGLNPKRNRNRNGRLRWRQNRHRSPNSRTYRRP